MRNYLIIPLITYAIGCGGVEVNRDREEQKKPTDYPVQAQVVPVPDSGYTIQPKVMPAPRCYREGMTGKETIECIMKDEDDEEEPGI